MLRPEVLDASRYPSIVVTANRLYGTWERPVAAASVTLRGTTRELRVPVDLRREPKALVAEGGFRIRQSDFGITPFSVGGGAIQVADEVEIDFVIVATAR
jgi:polyisoprenoid-binding protein YceI